VSLTAGAPWFAAERPALFVRISTAGATAELLEAGIEKLGAIAM
jgi:hypothetical protein